MEVPRLQASVSIIQRPLGVIEMETDLTSPFLRCSMSTWMPSGKISGYLGEKAKEASAPMLRFPVVWVYMIAGVGVLWWLML